MPTQQISPRMPSPRTISLSLVFVVLFYVAYILYAGQEALIIPIITRIASLWFAVSLGTGAVIILGILGIKPGENNSHLT